MTTTITDDNKRWGISGSTLKLIAIITMLIDHFGAAVLTRVLLDGGYLIAYPNMGEEWYQTQQFLIDAYQCCRSIGRVAFPIFCFLLVEGFQRTRDVRKYALRLGLFALVSEVPFDLALFGRVWNPENQNVFFTLLIGMLVLIGFDWICKRKWHRALEVLCMGVVFLAGCGLAHVLQTDYSYYGVIAISMLYLFRWNRWTQIGAGCVSFWWELPAPLGFLPVALYNGKRGWNLKYIFYCFYPVHLLILYFICYLCGMGGVSPTF